jgi:hypothetical protein
MAARGRFLLGDASLKLLGAQRHTTKQHPSVHIIPPVELLVPLPVPPVPDEGVDVVVSG